MALADPDFPEEEAGSLQRGQNEEDGGEISLSEEAQDAGRAWDAESERRHRQIKRGVIFAALGSFFHEVAAERPDARGDDAAEHDPGLVAHALPKVGE